MKPAMLCCGRDPMADASLNRNPILKFSPFDKSLTTAGDIVRKIQNPGLDRVGAELLKSALP
jgi:hypothetical protein